MHVPGRHDLACADGEAQHGQPTALPELVVYQALVTYQHNGGVPAGGGCRSKPVVHGAPIPVEATRSPAAPIRLGECQCEVHAERHQPHVLDSG
jgi:hypothetical protein